MVGGVSRGSGGLEWAGGSRMGRGASCGGRGPRVDGGGLVWVSGFLPDSVLPGPTRDRGRRQSERCLWFVPVGVPTLLFPRVPVSGRVVKRVVDQNPRSLIGRSSRPHSS